MSRRARLRAIALLLCLILAADSAAAQTMTVDRRNRSVTPDMRALPVHVGGRVRIDPLPPPLPKGAKAYVHEWPGVYFEAAFRGASVVLKFDDAANEYRLTVDSRAPIAIAQPGRVEIGLALAQGAHRLRLEKVTESVGHVGAFQGFYVPASARPLPVAPRARQIEFIGDSSMTGHGDRSPTRDCTDEQVRLTTDTQRTYPALVAKHFDADYQINAVSARGVIRNYAGILPDATLPRLYPYTFLEQKVPWRDPAWRPRIAVIKLNADFVGDLQPNEKWKDWDALLLDYAAGLGAFVADLHRRSPGAAILIWWFDTAAMNPNSAVLIGTARKTIEQAARAVGVTRIAFLPMTDLGYDRAACASHPSLADHRKTAAWLIAWLDAHPELWRAR